MTNNKLQKLADDVIDDYTFEYDQNFIADLLLDGKINFQYYAKRMPCVDGTELVDGLIDVFRKRIANKHLTLTDEELHEAKAAHERRNPEQVSLIERLRTSKRSSE